MVGDELLSGIGADLSSCDGIHFFPVRHHSPACAWQLARLLREVRPAVVLVEGPKDLGAQIRPLLDERTAPPVALYTSFADRANALGLDVPRAPASGPHRFAAFYPFCAYSPELVALRVGHELGARLRFIDLSYPEQVMAGRALLHGPQEARVSSLLSESHLLHSRRLAEMARHCGCRDHDDLWDHVFEQRAPYVKPDRFAREVAAYCALARADHSNELLEADGTAAREHHMARQIRTERRKHSPLVVVTGGFHTVVLPELVQRLPKRRPVHIEVADEDRCSVLVRYSFDQLDALNGYSAGMQSPKYYERVWQGLGDDPPAALLRAATDTIVEIGRLTRQRDMPVQLSVADEISALGQARNLAAFRSHSGPTREDVLDAMRSCFVRGEIQAEGAVLSQVVRMVLAGDRVGSVPPDTPAPPIVNDFHLQCRTVRLGLDDSAPKNRHLHLYRSAKHRRISQLFHRCSFLDVPLAHLQGGPDFVEGYGLDLLQEHWSYAWNPGIEARLIELAVYGSTVAEAALTLLAERSRQLQEEGRGRSAEAGVQLLLQACRMGLHELAADLLHEVAVVLDEDPELAAMVAAVSRLELLRRARAPLEGERLHALPDIVRRGYERCCALLDDCARVPDDRVAEVLDATTRLRELARGDSVDDVHNVDERSDASSDASTEDTENDGNDGANGNDRNDPGESSLGLDRDLLLDTAARLAARSDGTPAVVGAAAGMLFGEGRLTAGDLVRTVDGFLHSTRDGGSGRAGFVRGLLHTCREALWQVDGLIERLDRILSEWPEQEFLESLPELRLGLAVLTPREVERVAESVGSILGGVDLGELVHHDVNEDEVLLGARITAAVRSQLEQDGLHAWLEAGR